MNRTIPSLSDLPRRTDPKRLAVCVRAKAIPMLKRGHPWLFEDSASKITAGGKPGDVAVMYDPDGKILGAGLYDPDSVLRVRILQTSKTLPPVGDDLFRLLVQNAAALRFGQIPPRTTAWRLINGESDGFPGMVADRYANTLVLKFYSSAFVPWAGNIANVFFDADSSLANGVIRLSRSIENEPFVRSFLPEGSSTVFSRSGAPFDVPVRFQENGLTFEADVIRGQKTGFFLDQRDNRAEAGKLAADCRVLNVFSFSGGFSLYAARGGAKSVCSIDADPHAMEACERHFKLNSQTPSVAACSHEAIIGDAFEAMSDLAKKKRKFDLVIVDPPSFAKSAAERSGALHSYARLARLADSLLKTRGTLMFASCSSRVNSDDFFQCVLANCHVREWRRTAHAVDHPAKFAESSYLKCLYAEKMP